MKKLLSILGAFGISLTITSSVTACYPIKVKKSLRELPVQDIGELKGTKDLPTATEIINAVLDKNADFGISASDFEVSGKITTSSVKLKASSTSTNFRGKVIIRFSYIKEVDESSTINSMNLKLSKNYNKYINQLSITKIVIKNTKN
ncbi:lipoprotein [Spiroplasma tabanidicola]|uniref:Lipoprotein n=1 Tax=Spiroplasma tabanidicola TaxID=324079 RepID=A0A6I6CB36_9MOLU|nr:lipoprotein [Spiroplasma tabanidicola]QGS51388.1 hypothetical protein STABA_v1c00210 [Spiroplasma tabanidicola]